MTTAATSLLGLALPVTGELSGTWGDTVNNSITSLLDSAIAGTTTLSTDADVTLTTTTLSANQAREAIILWTAAGTVTRTITAPAQSKTYVVINKSSTQSIKLVGVGPTTGVTLVAGEYAVVAWNGTDFAKVAGYGGSLTVSALTNTSLTSGRVVYSTTGGLETDSANLTFNGTTLTAANTSITTSETLSYGTANGVAYLNGSKVVTTGSALTFDGTNVSNTGRFIVNNAGSAAGTTDISFGSYSGGTWINTPSATAGYLAVGGTGAYVWLSTYHQWNVSGSEQMRLTSTGLGIGTSSPAYKLTVEGTLAAKRSGANQYIGISTSAGDGYLDTINTLSADYIGFNFRQTNNAGTVTRAILDFSGNLGLGATPKTWFGSRLVLQISGTNSTAFAGVTDGTSEIWSNSYLDAAGTSRYVSNGYATLQQNNYGGVGCVTWKLAPSGTAGNAITFTQAMTLDASGTLTVAKTTNGQYNSILGSLAIGTGSAFVANNTEISSGNDIGIGTTGAQYLALYTNSAERARIDTSGRLLIAGTSSSNISGQAQNLLVYSSGTNAIGGYQTALGGYCFASYAVSNAGTYYHMVFSDAGTSHGSITSNGTTTSYNVTSDQRLKENVQDASPASALIDALQVRQYDWKSDGSHQRYGFIAQELVTVAPEAVHQPADPEEMMAVDYSKLVPMLVKEIQSLRARVAQLESK